MGKLAALIALASVTFGGMAFYNGPQRGVHGVEADQATQALSYTTREAARGGFAAALRAVDALPRPLGQGLDSLVGSEYTYWVQTGADGAVAVVVAAEAEANGVRHRHTIEAAFQLGPAGGGGSAGGGGAAGGAPDYLRYALFGGTKVANNGDVYVNAASGGNADVYTGGSIHINGSGRVQGFLDYSGSKSDHHVRDPSRMFQPPQNPDKASAVRAVTRVGAPPFDAAAWATKADEAHSRGLTLNSRSSTLQLGTRENPKVLYFNGDFRVNGDITLTGFGAIVVNGTTDISGSFRTSGTGTEVAFLTNGQVNVLGDVQVTGHLVGEEVRLGGRTTTVSGGVVATGVLENNTSRLTVDHRPFPPKLSERLFGATGPRTVTYRERPQQTRSTPLRTAATALQGLLAQASASAGTGK